MRYSEITEAGHGDDTFDIDEARSLFTAGYCHAFAEAASKLTGLPMVALEAREGRRWAIIHVMVQLPDEREFLDVDGIRSVHDILFDTDIDEDEVSWRLVPVSTAYWSKMFSRGMEQISPNMKTLASQAAVQVVHQEGLA